MSQAWVLRLPVSAWGKAANRADPALAEPGGLLLENPLSNGVSGLSLISLPNMNAVYLIFPHLEQEAI